MFQRMLIAAFIFVSARAFSQEKPFGDFAPLSKHAQKKVLKQARKKFIKGDYKASKEKYYELLKSDSVSFDYNFELGFLYYDTWFETVRSIPYLERALRHSPADTLGEIYYYLGDAYQLNNQPAIASSFYSKYLYRLEKYGTDLPKGEERALVEEVKHHIGQCKNAEALAAVRIGNFIEINGKKKELKLESIQGGINSSFDDYSPVLSPNDSIIFFTSRREGSTGGKVDLNDGKFYEDIYTSSLTKDGWIPAANLGTPINTKRHDASNFVSFDGKQLYIYKGVRNGSIYKSEKSGRGWSKPAKVGKTVNSRAWETSSIVIAGNALYIVSERKGGFGGRDIYKCAKKEDGTWGEPENLGDKINTPWDEDAPFFTPDGKTLFFSSTGHNSIGGFDIFKSTMTDDGKWTQPENLYPLNSTAHDIYFVLDSKIKNAYFSSNRLRDSICDMNIFAVSFECENLPLTVIKGFAKAGTAISVTEKSTGKLIGNYTAGTEGEYIIRLAPENTYLFSIDGEKNTGSKPAEIFVPKQCRPFDLLQKLGIDTTFQQNVASAVMNYTAIGTFQNLFFENDMNEKPVVLFVKARKERPEGYSISSTSAAGTIAAKPVTLAAEFESILFEYDKAVLRKEGKEELSNLVTYLKKNKNETLEIAAHTDDRGTDDYNQRLSERRAKAVVAYLTSKGIYAKRIQSKAYGKTKPVAPNDSEEGRAKNRRVEIWLVK